MNNKQKGNKQMRNLVKEYIESGKSFDDLKNEFGISCNEFGDLICLNYDQIESPKTALIVRQCRGIVLDKNTLEIVHYPFFRFYNLDEVYEEREKFDFKEMTQVYALEKLDGSLFGVFNHNGIWYISTRSQIGGKNMLSIGLITFGDLFNKAIGMDREKFFAKLDSNYDYTFELVGPDNQIVTPYENTELYLIGVRIKSDDFHEENPLLLRGELPDFIKFPKLFKIIDDNGMFIGFEDLKLQANKMDHPTDEGFVLVDFGSYNDEFGYFPRIKVKNSSYVALHHLRGTLENGSINMGSILETIWKGEKDEVLANFANFKSYFDDVENRFNNFMNIFNSVVNSLEKYWNIPMDERNSKEIKKEFASHVDMRFSAFLFAMFNKGVSFKDFIEKNSAVHPNYFKKFWDDYVSKY
jgi:hypothetical protein